MGSINICTQLNLAQKTLRTLLLKTHRARDAQTAPMKTLTYLITILLLSATQTMAAEPHYWAKEIFQQIPIGELEPPSLSTVSNDTAWKKFFINNHTKTENTIQISSGKLFDQEYNIRFLYQKNKLRLDSESRLLDHEYYQLDSRINGDWGDITLSFENRQIESNTGKLLPTSPSPSQDESFLSSGFSKTRTNGRGRLKLPEGFGLEIELEYITSDSIDLEYSNLNPPTLAYSTNLSTSFGDLNTRTVYFHMDRNHDFSRYGDYSLDTNRTRGFRPLYILTGSQTDIFTADADSNSLSSHTRKGGIDGIAFIVAYKASPRIDLHTAIGAANADKTPVGYVDYYGWEANIGLGYKILDNLTYELHLGYMATGDYFKNGDEEIETDDITIITQHLTLKF